MEARAQWLADLCREHGLTRVIEVGVHRGHFSRWLLDANPALGVLGVDPYQAYAENTTDRTADRAEAAAIYAAYPDRAWLLICTSEFAAREMVVSAQCVYIDGAHDTGSVMLDCQLWWAKLVPGGILSGHDYNHAPVAAAVGAFAARHGLEVKTFTAVESEGIVRTNWYVIR